MGRWLALATLVLVLALAAGASAKVRMDVSICGSDRCVTVRDDLADGESVLGDAVFGAVYVNFDALVEAPAATAYLRVAVGVDSLEPKQRYLVPRLGLLYDPPNWIGLEPAVARSVRRLVAPLSPFRPPRVIRATLDGRAVADPAAYAGLIRALPGAASPAPGTPLLRVELRSRRPTPWTQEAGLIQVAPLAGLVLRDGVWRRVPAGLTATLRRDAGIGRMPP